MHGTGFGESHKADGDEHMEEGNHIGKQEVRTQSSTIILSHELAWVL